MRRSLIAGIGSYLPERVLTNQELARMVETSDDWIRQRTGIEERRIAADDQLTSDLAIQAAQAALGDAGMAASEIDLIILATTTPDNVFPATAMKVQTALGCGLCTAFDLQAVCSGFVYALSVADAMLKSGTHQTALVIGADCFSRLIDWSDRATCVLFGDGAGAVVLRAEERTEKAGILSSHLYGDGAHYHDLYVDNDPVTAAAGSVRMDGRAVYKQAIHRISQVMEEALRANHLTAADVDWVVPHQANRRIIESSAEKIDVPLEKIIITISKHGNTSAASVPLAWAEAVADGRIKRGDLVLLDAMGGGLTWAATLLHY